MGVNVYRFEYEILPNLNPWSVFIAAFSNEEAYKHLTRTVKSQIRITSSTMVCRLDDLSNEVRQNVITAFLNTKGKNREKEVAKKETDVSVGTIEPENKKVGKK